jgi:sensor c-di-GMP phosphodiesterase-like protein
MFLSFCLKHTFVYILAQGICVLGVVFQQASVLSDDRNECDEDICNEDDEKMQEAKDRQEANESQEASESQEATATQEATASHEHIAHLRQQFSGWPRDSAARAQSSCPTCTGARRTTSPDEVHARSPLR